MSALPNSGFPELQKMLKELGTDEVFKIAKIAHKESLAPVRLAAFQDFRSKVGKWDGKRNANQASWRWGGKSRGVSHPEGESRNLLALALSRNAPKPKLVKGKRSVWTRVWETTQNAHLVEIGRHKDAARAYAGWNILNNAMNRLRGKVLAIQYLEFEEGIERFKKRLAKSVQPKAGVS